MKRLNYVLLFGVIMVFAGMLHAQITITSMNDVDIKVGGAVEFEFVDVEGPGGFANQDKTLKKVDNRSPHVRVDKAILEFNAIYSENFQYHLEYRFDDEKARIDKHYATFKLPAINTNLEFGKNRPFCSTKRKTEGYPLIGTAFWKGREIHAVSETEMELGKIKLIGGLSIAMKRALGTDDAAEDKSFRMIVYDNYEVKNGQTFEYGAKAAIGIGGLLAEGWGYYGELIDDFDWKTQLKDGLNTYQEIEDSTADMTHFWLGGRLTWEIGPFHVRGEYIYAKDGLLPREGAYGELGYTNKTVANWLPIKSMSLYARHGFLNLKNLTYSDGDTHVWAYLSEPMSWSRQMTTLALLTKINKLVTIKTEYYWLDEETNSTTQSSVDDNQLVVQIEFKF